MIASFIKCPIQNHCRNPPTVMQQHHVPQQRNASKPIKASVKGSSEQPSISRLANLGIKVRDFAYDSKLPPIQTIYCHPRQIQPAVVKTTLKHQQNDNLFSQSSSHPETSQKKLKRTSTEPVIPPSPNSTDIDGDDDFTQLSSQRETSQKNLPVERTSTAPAIPLTPTPDSTDTDSDSDDLFSQSSSHPETIQKKMKRTSTEPVILPTPDSTDVDGDNYFSQSSSQQETSQKNLPVERTSTAPAIPLTPTPSPDSTDTDTDSDDYFSQFTYPSPRGLAGVSLINVVSFHFQY